MIYNIRIQELPSGKIETYLQISDGNSPPMEVFLVTNQMPSLSAIMKYFEYAKELFA